MICLDNFFTGSKDNIKHLIGRPNFELMRCARRGCLYSQCLIPCAAVSSCSCVPGMLVAGSCAAARREAGACPPKLTVVSCTRLLDSEMEVRGRRHAGTMS